VKKLMMVVAFVFIAVLSSCSGGGEGIKTYTDANQPVEVGVNGQFVIALESNPTTGYSWQESHDEAMVKLGDKSYKQGGSGEKSLVGAGGTEYFTFQALKKGGTKITLVYRRTSEQPSPQDKTSVFTVKIN
jgi:inhibitor of cysteine peptidase